MSNKKWVFSKVIPKKLQSKFSDINKVTLQLLYNRNIESNEEIRYFLEPEYTKDSLDPFLFKDMEKAVDLIVKHVKNKNKILVYGDYDADGVTSSALLIDVLGSLKANVSIYIPNRVTEGYGLNKPAIEGIKDRGVDLIITVDGGIRNKEEISYAKELGMDVILTDHHVPPENDSELPDCLIINPLVKGNKYPYKKLAGVGVAFKLAKALIGRSKLSDEDKVFLEKRTLDLVAIGTVADCVSLIGENRVLLQEGLRSLNVSARIGVRELIKVAKINSDFLDAWNIGFQIAPRLNAAGRIDHANTAFELLVTRDENEAKSLAIRLNESNITRQNITESIVSEADSQVDESDGNKLIVALSPSILEGGESWNEGVIGLAAGRLSEKYYRPVLVLTSSGSEIKGSARSIEEFNIVNAIEASGEHLEKYGGHARAAGFSIKSKDKMVKFLDSMHDLANKSLNKKTLLPTISIEAELDLAEINDELTLELEKFMPFGMDNPKPKFACTNARIIDIMKMGMEGQHIKLRVKDEDSRIFSAIGFGQTEKWQDLKIDDEIDIVYYLEMNRFNGREEAQLKIVDIKKSN